MSGFSTKLEPFLITSFLAAAAVGASGWLFQAAEGEKPTDSYPIEVRPMLLFVKHLLQGFRDRRDARMQIRRRRLAARLTPVESERGWLFEVLPPEITQAVLACLDSSSMKSLRASSRQCHQVVSEHTTKLVLGARGVQHFTTVPLYKVYPSLTELAIGRGVNALQIIELLQARGLERLDLTLLDLSRCAAPWTIPRWRSFLLLLPDGLHLKLNPRCLPNDHACGKVGPATLQYNPNASIYSSLLGMFSDARDVAAALSLLARLQPSTVVELEGPDGASVIVKCDGQRALDRLCHCSQVVKLALETGPMPSWSQWNFSRIHNLHNLTQLSVRAEDPTVALSLVQALKSACPLLTTLRLRSSVLNSACLPAIADLPALRNLQVASVHLLITPDTNLPNLHRLVVTGTVKLPDDLSMAGLAPSLQALSLFPLGVTKPFNLIQAIPAPPIAAPAAAAAAAAPPILPAAPPLASGGASHMGSGSNGGSSSSSSASSVPHHHPSSAHPNPHAHQQPQHQNQQQHPLPHHQQPHVLQHTQILHQQSAAAAHTGTSLSPSTLIELSFAASTTQEAGKIDPVTLPGLTRLLNNPLALQQLQRFRIWRILDQEDLNNILDLVISSAGSNLREVELHHCCTAPPPRPASAVLNNSSLVRGGAGNAAVHGCGPFFTYTARQVLTNAQDIPRAMTTAGHMLGMTLGETALQPAAALLMGVESVTLVEGGGASIVKCLALHALQRAMTLVSSLPELASAAAAARNHLAAQRQWPRNFAASELSDSQSSGSGEDEESEDEESEDGTEDSSGSQQDEDEEEEEQSDDGQAYTSSETGTTEASSAGRVFAGLSEEDTTMKLHSLRLVNVSGLTMGSLALLMRHTTQLRKLEICGCPGVSLEWVMQARIDARRRSLTIDFAGV